MKLYSQIIVYTLTAVVLSGCNYRDPSTPELKKVYFKDGKTLQQTVEYRNGKKNGYLTEFYKTGTLRAKQFYVNDSLNDSSFIYHPNGKLQSLHTYKNKLKHGCWKEYNKEGKLYSEIFLKNDKLDSTSTIFTYRTGKVLTRVTYKDGLKNGLEERYYANGKPRSKAVYDMGKPCLGVEEWFDNGKKVNNDFGIQVIERNELLLNNTVSYLIKPEGFRQDDDAYQILPPVKGKGIEAFRPLTKTKEGFLLKYEVVKGKHIMTKECLGIFRKTVMGNTLIKVHTINVAIDNY
jgi:antitoxin component YwqK of YwqJK toxin-antitoxin module